MSPGKVRESERRGERDLAQFEVGCGAVGEEGDVAGVEERAAGVVLDGRLEEGLAVGFIAGLLRAPRRLRRCVHGTPASLGMVDGSTLRRPSVHLAGARGLMVRRAGGD